MEGLILFHLKVCFMSPIFNVVTSEVLKVVHIEDSITQQLVQVTQTIHAELFGDTGRVIVRLGHSQWIISLVHTNHEQIMRFHDLIRKGTQKVRSPLPCPIANGRTKPQDNLGTVKVGEDIGFQSLVIGPQNPIVVQSILVATNVLVFKGYQVFNASLERCLFNVNGIKGNALLSSLAQGIQENRRLGHGATAQFNNGTSIRNERNKTVHLVLENVFFTSRQVVLFTFHLSNVVEQVEAILVVKNLGGQTPGGLRVVHLTHVTIGLKDGVGWTGTQMIGRRLDKVGQQFMLGRDLSIARAHIQHAIGSTTVSPAKCFVKVGTDLMSEFVANFIVVGLRRAKGVGRQVCKCSRHGVFL
mmetsp:Transcript_2836/g.5722  ORF Transcript_2836/g.5722 Transcript_2836/m.5722 type:complete len:357 (+) Transcript_2836:1708-2778(+)